MARRSRAGSEPAITPGYWVAVEDITRRSGHR